MTTPPGSGAGSRFRTLQVASSARRSPAAMVLILLVLLPTALLLGWWGIEDLSGALTYTGRITGAILVLVSALSFLGAAAVVDHWFRNSFPYSGMVALIGTVAALLTNTMLLLETFRDGDSTLYQVLWSLLTAGSLWAVITVWRTSVMIPAPKRVAAALIVSSGLAMANFGYEHLYQPYQRGARPLISLAVGKPVLSQDRNKFSVPVDIKLENPSDTGFYVLGAEFHAMGEQVPLTAKDRLRQQWRTDAAQQREFRERSPLSRREIHEPGQLVTAQPWMDAGYWIEARDAFVTRTVVQLPIGTPYDDLAFYATASFARKDRIGLEHFGPIRYSWLGGKLPPWMQTKNNDIDAVIYHSRVRENNSIDDHTRDPRYLTVYWQFGTHGAGVDWTITRKGEEDRVIPGAETLLSRYGIVDAQAGPIERTLWDIKSQR
ncbi:hypothetical protein ABT173_35185 [Streptomyces sp. NPDC001795]|uniref:hypothetical protein n=1 Tax=unclassified Streptomyces TaxID=2593676 RepID=UPI00331BF0C1